MGLITLCLQVVAPPLPHPPQILYSSMPNNSGWRMPDRCYSETMRVEAGVSSEVYRRSIVVGLCYVVLHRVVLLCCVVLYCGLLYCGAGCIVLCCIVLRCALCSCCCCGRGCDCVQAFPCPSSSLCSTPTMANGSWTFSCHGWKVTAPFSHMEQHGVLSIDSHPKTSGIPALTMEDNCSG